MNPKKQCAGCRASINELEGLRHKKYNSNDNDSYLDGYIDGIDAALEIFNPSIQKCIVCGERVHIHMLSIGGKCPLCAPVEFRDL